jgi:hypothetical protein
VGVNDMGEVVGYPFRHHIFPAKSAALGLK